MGTTNVISKRKKTNAQKDRLYTGLCLEMVGLMAMRICVHEKAHTVLIFDLRSFVPLANKKIIPKNTSRSTLLTQASFDFISTISFASHTYQSCFYYTTF